MAGSKTVGQRYPILSTGITLDHGKHINELVQCHLDRLLHRTVSRFDCGRRNLDVASIEYERRARHVN